VRADTNDFRQFEPPVHHAGFIGADDPVRRSPGPGADANAVAFALEPPEGCGSVRLQRIAELAIGTRPQNDARAFRRQVELPQAGALDAVSARPQRVLNVLGGEDRLRIAPVQAERHGGSVKRRHHHKTTQQ